MFEIIATLCLSGICMERVLPQETVVSQAVCEATLDAHVENWLSEHEGYSVDTQACVETTTLQSRAAALSQVSPGQFVHQGMVADFTTDNAGDIANTGFIVGSESVAVVDAGSSRKVAEALYLAIRTTTSLPIRFNFLTHMHPDHTLGADVFREAGAELIGAPKLSESLNMRSDTYIANLERLIGKKAFHGTQAVLPSRSIHGNRETVDIGNRKLILQSWPTAHTTNDMTILDEMSSIIWMGDLTFLEHTPALDGSILGWIELLEDLSVDKALKMVPGHGPAIAEFPDGFHPTLQYLTQLRDQTRASIDTGQSMGSALKSVGQDLRQQWQRFDQFHPRNVTHAYKELEWE